MEVSNSTKKAIRKTCKVQKTRYGVYYIEVNSDKLSDELENFLDEYLDCEIQNYPSFKRFLFGNDVNEIISGINKYLKSNSDIDDGIITTILNQFTKIKKTIEDIRTLVQTDSNTKVTFDQLQNIFQSNDFIIFYGLDNMIRGGIVVNIYSESYFATSFCSIEYMCLDYNKGNYISVRKNFRIGEYEGSKTLKQLGLSFPTDEQCQYLINRGKLFQQYIENKSTYCEYTGMAYRSLGWLGKVPFSANGRCVADPLNCSNFDPNGFDIYGDDINIKITDSFLRTAPSQIPGYSLTMKMWGYFNIDNLSAVTYNDNAFNMLNLDTNRKNILRSLVTTQSDFNDLISNKGKGLIFLLHGTPGVGKTLTAEALAEELHKPLYMVSIGELGTNASALEESLRDILNLATIWDAILLIDEADIFLEERSSDIERNAMVGIFLRMLEYYSGVLFMTTNRIKVIDPAFLSRISMVVHYDELTPKSRYEIWDILAKHQGIILNHNDLDILKNIKINGRQIKNCLRLAMTLAKSNKQPFTIDHITEILQFLNIEK